MLKLVLSILIVSLFAENQSLIFFLRIFFDFVNMGPYGSKHFKTLPLLQIAAESVETSAELSSQ